MWVIFRGYKLILIFCDIFFVSCVYNLEYIFLNDKRLKVREVINNENDFLKRDNRNIDFL